MTTATVRLATSEDVPALAALRRRWTEEDAGHPIDDPDFEAGFVSWHRREAPSRHSWLAEIDETPVGMINMAIFNRMPRPGQPASSWGYLANVFVLRDYRNSTVGRQLLDAVTSYADEHGLVRLVLSPSDRSVPFYRRAGFGPADMLLARELES